MKADGSRIGALLVPHRLLSSVRRRLEGLATHAVQRLGGLPSARWQMLTRAGRDRLREVALRWPQLAALLGLDGATSTERAAASWSPARDRGPAAQPHDDESARARAGGLATLRGSTDVARRVSAADSLAPFIDEETTGALVAALRDPSSEVAVHAAEALRLHRGPVAVSALLEVLANADSYFLAETRASAVRALGALLPPGEGAPLHVTVTDPQAAVSLAAIAALAERDEPPGADALLGVIERADGFYLPITRHAAARALSRMRGHDVARLRAIADREADPEVRSVLASLAPPA